MRERERKTAERFNVVDKVEQLKKQIMEIADASKVDVSLDGLYDDIYQVIILPEYDIPVNDDNYFKRRRIFLNSVLMVAEKNGLSRTEDRIEDYGSGFYIVTSCDKSWRSRIKEVSDDE